MLALNDHGSDERSRALRVSKSNGKLYWYGSGGEILAETDASGNTLNEYIFFGGKRIAILPSGGSAEYYLEDLLGSSRLMTTNNGTVCYDADFDPYGGEHAYTNTCSQNYKFEGKERDTETGNDDFGARYYTSRFGRWLSADWSSVPAPVPYANLTNPQTLNLYAMVSDDPETSADLDGHIQNASQGETYPGDSGGPSCAANGQGGNGSADSGNCGANQTANQTEDQQQAEAAKEQAQNQNQDQTQQNQQPTNENKDKKQDQEKDQKETPLDAGSGSRGGQGRQPRGGERGKTSKPDNPRKHARPSDEHPGQWEVQDHQTGKWVLKPKGWSPETTKRVILGVEVGATAYIIYRVVRMLPSLAPPLWETIPLNAAIP